MRPLLAKIVFPLAKLVIEQVDVVGDAVFVQELIELSSHAIAVDIEIMRAFVRMRELLASNEELAQNLAELERTVDST